MIQPVEHAEVGWKSLIDPSTPAGTLVLAVFAGILTTFLLFGLTKLFSGVVLPWYLQLIYKGIDLRGVWLAEYDENGAHYRFETRLQQRAHELWGHMTITKTGTGQHDYVQDFKVVGETWEGFLTLNFRSRDRKSLSFVTGLFKVDARGNKLIGHIAYRDAGATDSVKSEPANWTRR